MDSMGVNDIGLIMTCVSCPEQYDAYYHHKKIAYLRLRHGTFTVRVPDEAGEVVYCVEPDGDGMFTDRERQHYLNCARMAIANKYNNK